MIRVVFLFFFCGFLFACHSPQENAAAGDSALRKALDSAIHADELDIDEGEFYENISCADLENKSVIFHFAKAHAFTSYINTFDTSNVLLIKGHFIDNKTEQTLVWIADYPMPSCGDGCNLVMLFNCGSVARLLMNFNAGVFTKENVRDLDNDGVLEIVAESGICRMGECHSNYDIFNLADTVQNMLYHAHTYSMLEEENWGDNYEGYFKKGDTLRDSIGSRLVRAPGDNVYKVMQVRKVEIYNGGKKVKEMEQQKIVRIDSSIVPLKEVK